MVAKEKEILVRTLLVLSHYVHYDTLDTDVIIPSGTLYPGTPLPIWCDQSELFFLKLSRPALVAQLDVHATGDQDVTGLTPALSATFFHGD